MSESTTNPYKIANQYRKARKIAETVRGMGIKSIDFNALDGAIKHAVLEVNGYDAASNETWALVAAILEDES